MVGPNSAWFKLFVPDLIFMIITDKEKILSTARLLAEEGPIENTDLASYLKISKQSAAGYLRRNYLSIGLEVEKIHLGPSQSPRPIYYVSGKTDESYLLKKRQKKSEILKKLRITPPVKKDTGNFDLNHEPNKKNENRIPYHVLNLAEHSANRTKK
jgi:hypothetical protein